MTTLFSINNNQSNTSIQNNNSVFRRDSNLKNNTIEQDINQSTILHNKTYNEFMVTAKDKTTNHDKNENKGECANIKENEELNIGQTYENRNTILCFENSGEHNTILTSQMYTNNFLFTNSRFGKQKAKPWVSYGPQKGIKVMNRDLEILKSGKTIK